VINKLALDVSGLKRVGQEIAVWENLEHPGVIQLHEVIITDSYYAFVCEYAQRYVGGTRAIVIQWLAWCVRARLSDSWASLG
jgi:hypothetical protein